MHPKFYDIVPCVPFKSKNMEQNLFIIQQLERIKSYTLLAAKNVLDIDDVVSLTGLAKSYVYKLTCRKEIPYYKPNGKLIYFDRQEVENWMKQNKFYC